MLAVAGGKGGTGTTITTLGLAAALAGQRRRPVAVDADARAPNLHLAAGLDPPGGVERSGVERVAAGEPVADAARVPPRFPGVDVLTAEPDADVCGALARLGDRRPTLVDCPSGGGRPAAVPLRAAAAAVLVTTSRRQAVEDARKTAATARALDAPIAGVVASKTGTVPDGFAAAFDAPAVAVPDADADPLTDAGVGAAHDRLAEKLSLRGEFPTAVRTGDPAASRPARETGSDGTGRSRVPDGNGRSEHRDPGSDARGASESRESRPRGREG